MTENQLAKNKGKEVWMTEHLDTNITYAANLIPPWKYMTALPKQTLMPIFGGMVNVFMDPIGQDGLLPGEDI